MRQTETPGQALGRTAPRVTACATTDQRVETALDQGIPRLAGCLPGYNMSGMKMITLMKVAWVIILLGGVALVWWFSYGSWRLHGDTLLEHDIVRFGPVPLVLSCVWVLLLFLVLLATLHSSTHRKT